MHFEKPLNFKVIVSVFQDTMEETLHNLLIDSVQLNTIVLINNGICADLLQNFVIHQQFFFMIITEI